ncbi:hypothetical protein DFA_02993 [Cavenderia fasciculata]|uniref:Transmembrane protein n=1 Tax=Cavenderia fasciculata TaxID=261658 RepID=F4PGB5_CACFS|nr:uncharacterized protein DFA_02993 [Cavenderia fasciculata]EGG24749.1 hypothetical protein DFA_02993 [Cavenderia fasciculata]|eukprot:XP_004362600.1 hypothetical protein DFA_02993 [Cavenderia fasciculata]
MTTTIQQILLIPLLVVFILYSSTSVLSPLTVVNGLDISDTVQVINDPFVLGNNENLNLVNATIILNTTNIYISPTSSITTRYDCAIKSTSNLNITIASLIGSFNGSFEISTIYLENITIEMTANSTLYDTIIEMNNSSGLIVNSVNLIGLYNYLGDGESIFKGGRITTQSYNPQFCGVFIHPGNVLKASGMPLPTWVLRTTVYNSRVFSTVLPILVPSTEYLRGTMTGKYNFFGKLTTSPRTTLLFTDFGLTIYDMDLQGGAINVTNSVWDLSYNVTRVVNSTINFRTNSTFVINQIAPDLGVSPFECPQSCLNATTLCSPYYGCNVGQIQCLGSQACVDTLDQCDLYGSVPLPFSTRFIKSNSDVYAEHRSNAAIWSQANSELEIKSNSHLVIPSGLLPSTIQLVQYSSMADSLALQVNGSKIRSDFSYFNHIISPPLKLQLYNATTKTFFKHWNFQNNTVSLYYNLGADFKHDLDAICLAFINSNNEWECTPFTITPRLNGILETKTTHFSSFALLLKYDKNGEQEESKEGTVSKQKMIIIATSVVGGIVLSAIGVALVVNFKIKNHSFRRWSVRVSKEDISDLDRYKQKNFRAT